MIIINTVRYYVGVDTHKFTHTACLINYDTDKLFTITFKNEPAYFDEVLSKIIKVTKCKDVMFGLEDTQSFGFTFAQYLTNMGFVVKPVSPALGNAYRKSLPNYHKSDTFDAFCVAKILKDSHKQLPTFKDDILFKNIRLLVNQRTQLVKQRSIDYIMLNQQITKIYPGYTEFFCNLHVKSALAFFEHFPSPRHLKGYTKEMLVEETKTYTRLFSETRAEKILMIVRANKLPYDDTFVEDMVVELIEDIHYKEKKILHLEKQLEPVIEEIGYKLHSIPGINIATEAKLISEIGNIERFKSQNQLARYAGIAPVSIGSASKSIEESSQGGNRKLRAIFHFLAVGMITVNNKDKARHPLFRDYYLQRIADGKTKQQALLCVMRQLVKIIYSMMKNKSEWVMPEHIQKLTLTKDGKVVDRTNN